MQSKPGRYLAGLGDRVEDPESARLKLHLDTKTNSSRSKVIQKMHETQAGLCWTVWVYKANLVRRVCGAGGFMLWLIAGNERLVCWWAEREQVWSKPWKHRDQRCNITQNLTKFYWSNAFGVEKHEWSKNIAARSLMMLSCVIFFPPPYCEHNFKNDRKKRGGLQSWAESKFLHCILKWQHNQPDFTDHLLDWARASKPWGKYTLEKEQFPQDHTALLH